jgi:hypothetical protein
MMETFGRLGRARIAIDGHSGTYVAGPDIDSMVGAAGLEPATSCV